MGDAGKRAAGAAAADLVRAGMHLGLGTGSTVACFLDALASRGLDVAGVPTSQATARRCAELGVGVLDPADVERLDLAVDGADQLTPGLALTKGGGGALLREKVVAAMAEQFVVVATPDKVVDRLGATFPLPVEVVPFALHPVARRLARSGYRVTQRRTDDGSAYLTDNGNAVLDCRLERGIADPAATEAELARIPGVAECGLFVGLAHRALLGHDDGRVDELTAVPR